MPCDPSSHRINGITMTQTEAKMRILAQWRIWIHQEQGVPPYTAALALRFFTDIQRSHPELLEFSAEADKWQIVKGWLEHAALIKG
jgi:hypothetical protein